MKGLFTIPFQEDFITVLTQQLCQETRHDPLALREYMLFFPTQRALREGKKKLVALHQSPSLILPKMISLGQIEKELGESAEAPLAVLPALKRQTLLARLIKSRQKEGMTTAQALKLAASLMGLIDQIHLEDLDLETLTTLVEGDYAKHWQITLDFLRIITEHWPKILQEQGVVEEVVHRKQCIHALLASWQNDPPASPVLLAGSTGSLALTRRLMKGLLTLPQGCVILPGFEAEMYEEALSLPSHPHHTLSQTVLDLGKDPHQVMLWPGCQKEPSLSLTLVKRAFKSPLIPQNPEKPMEGLHLVDCKNELEEAAVISLMIRENLEHPDRTTLFITPDPHLARRVQWCLRRWNIETNSSSGIPLSETSEGILLRILAEFLITPENPVLLMTMLKHPLVRLGEKPEVMRPLIRTFERVYLRQKEEPLSALEACVSSVQEPDLRTLLETFVRCLASLRTITTESLLPFGSFMKKVMAFLEEVTRSDRGDILLFASDAGQEMASFLKTLQSFEAIFPATSLQELPGALDLLMRGILVRPQMRSHPRVDILGTLESRLLTADRIIFGGLNEGTWPGEASTGPWLSRPMRTDFGLQPLEQQIGLAAHDFMRGFSASEVYLTRSVKKAGTPTLPSRWILRLEALLASHPQWKAKAALYTQWAKALDHPASFIKETPPAPRPPVEKRPRRLSVSDIELWRRDPYALYARHILKLRKIPPLARAWGPLERGILIHRCLEDYKNHPSQTLETLIHIGKDLFMPFFSLPFVEAFWWSRFLQSAQWFITQDVPHETHQTITECKGSIKVHGLTLVAKADRLDQRTDGSYRIIDYKTGALPTQKAVDLGYSPQLPLEGFLLRRHGFGDLLPPPEAPIFLEYWRIGGEETGGERRLIPLTPSLMENTERGLQTLIEAFNRPETPYRPCPRPEWEAGSSEYIALSRLEEWGR